jgi:aminoglycoside 6-adenylyltransferase
MQNLISKREDLLRKIIAWGESSAEIKALVLIGSSTREDPPADEWSDIDLVLIAADPGAYLDSNERFAALGEPWIATVERGPDGKIVERRILFRSGIDADFIVISPGHMQAFAEEPLKSITARGAKILVDKEKLLPELESEKRQAAAPEAPTGETFGELVNDFWFHSVWTAKKLRRGELWTAKSCCDGYMKRLLLAMVEWHAAAPGGAAWYNGRFIERWARADIVAQLEHTFAHYEEGDVWKALVKTMELFDAVARETARRLGYAYPEEEAQRIARWVTARLEAR